MWGYINISNIAFFVKTAIISFTFLSYSNSMTFLVVLAFQNEKRRLLLDPDFVLCCGCSH